MYVGFPQESHCILLMALQASGCFLNRVKLCKWLPLLGRDLDFPVSVEMPCVHGRSSDLLQKVLIHVGV